ncbi:hypothetical protein chiPu_0019361 [Chiloscyllium punctatum]|uniref:Uncharacterized protein n=1 Tax=Chiloscyllium punctatum TaxID=137246 RepID=A0A401RRM7_CHIPU|nr:hypothetical protein [Chiloscyllium punctatum]
MYECNNYLKDQNNVTCLWYKAKCDQFLLTNSRMCSGGKWMQFRNVLEPINLLSQKAVKSLQSVRSHMQSRADAARPAQFLKQFVSVHVKSSARPQ